MCRPCQLPRVKQLQSHKTTRARQAGGQRGQPTLVQLVRWLIAPRTHGPTNVQGSMALSTWMGRRKKRHYKRKKHVKLEWAPSTSSNRDPIPKTATWSKTEPKINPHTQSGTRPTWFNRNRNPSPKTSCRAHGTRLQTQRASLDRAQHRERRLPICAKAEHQRATHWFPLTLVTIRLQLANSPATHWFPRINEESRHQMVGDTSNDVHQRVPGDSHPNQWALSCKPFNAFKVP